MSLHRITTSLLIIEIALAAILLGGSVSHAFSLGDIGITRPQSLDVEFISESQGVNGTRYETCTGDIYSLFNDNLDAQAEQWLRDSMNAMFEKMKSQLPTMAFCAVKSSLGKWTIGALTAVMRVLGASTECNQIESSDIASQMMQEAKNRLKSNFLVRCSSTIGYDYVTQTVTGMIQTQGPDGGMAAATDWSYLSSVRPAEMAQRQWWAMLVNTNICPWFREQALNDLGVPQSYRDSPPAINAMGYRVDERAPFAVRAGCTLPDDFDISDTSAATMERLGDYAILDILEEAQNKPRGFEAMALEEFERLKITLQNDASNQLIAGGGFTGTFGECAKDANGKCYDDGSMKVVPGALRDYNAAEVTSLYSRVGDVSGEDGPLSDVPAQLQIRLLDLANAPLPLQLEMGPERNSANFTPRPVATPTNTTPANPTCTAPTGCTCLTNSDPQAAMKPLVASAIAEAIVQHTMDGLFDASGQVLGDPRLALQAICDSFTGAVCTPHPSQNNAIVITMGEAGSTSFIVINSTGALDTTGGTPDMYCGPGY